MLNYTYCYLISPLHTGGTTQEGNLVGIARESHTKIPYIPSSTIRGKLRAIIPDQTTRFRLFGNELTQAEQLEQGNIWIGDGLIIWFPIPSLSHGVIWISSPFLLRRWCRGQENLLNNLPREFSNNFANGTTSVYLKDAIIPSEQLTKWDNWQDFVPSGAGINKVLILPDQHCATLIEMSLWRQVKIKLDQNKTVDGGFRYEEAIPPDTLIYFTWGTTFQANGQGNQSQQDFANLIEDNPIIQIGGQESLGRGFLQILN
ncbi:MAG: type III-B CRISPR module RAMP protein Cmr4 [Gloeocapsa sp. DLM2.Bin57]|nr:MAG: type III-B CRISPR module RAMP protein Cmr4 [Gloeocapsa sp. DLM2.Bin57]